MEFTILDEDKNLEPVTFTRPAFSIKVGGLTLYEMLKFYFKGCSINYKTVKELSKLSLRTCPSEGKRGFLLNSRVVPSIENMKKIKSGKGNLDCLEFPHDIIIWNKRLLKENVEFLSKNLKRFKKIKKDVFVGKGVKIHPSVVFDVSNGKIILDDFSNIKPFSYIVGPVYLGKNSIVNEHSSIKKSTIGSVCKVGGEIEESIIMDYSNKQHHGYLGNSYVGSWVNIGAGTSNSDLKNTYGNVNVMGHDEKNIKTNEQFLGCVICDFSKTAINTSIFTGKTIGVNSSVSGIVSVDAPSFINHLQGLSKEDSVFFIEKAIETQGKMFVRRGTKQDKIDIDILKYAFKASEDSRNKHLKNRK